MSASTDKPSREQLSKTPSWIMVGFVLGCLATITVERDLNEEKEEAKAKLPVPAPVVRPEPAVNTITRINDKPSLAVVEALFSKSVDRAIWRGNTTEFEAWNQATGKFTDYFEVVRSDGLYYFRSIPNLTRPPFEPEKNQSELLIFTSDPDKTKATPLLPPIYP